MKIGVPSEIKAQESRVGLNVDVFDRIKEFNKAKNIGEINLTNGLNSIK